MKGLAIMLLATGVTGTAIAEGDKDTWNLADIYPSVEAWYEAKDALEARFPDVEKCRGHLGDSAQKLLECSEMLSDMFKEWARISSYAAMASDADTRDADNQQRRTEIGIMSSKFGEQLSFISPEILEIGEETLRSYLDELDALEPYALNILDTLRQAEHVLSEDAEQMMAATSLFSGSAANTYRTLTNADMPWPTITLSTGEEVRLDQSGYTKHRSSDNRADRKAVFDAFFGKWKEFERTLGTTLSGQVNVHVFSHRQRNYPNALAAALDANNIPEEVYRTLVSETGENLGTLHRYFKLRGRMLGVEDLGYHDIYPSLVESEKEFPIEIGKRLTLEASAPLGNAYTEVMASGFENRWMDVYPREGKVSGAYMNGSVYDEHPFVLMNYNDDYESVSTLAHEWGHAMHSYLSNTNQPYPTARYSIFTAEIASTFNEALLLEHMLKHAENDDERLYYLGSALENLRGTYFRQTMFAEFELAIHEAAEAGQALTGQQLTAIYGDLLRRYHGHDEGVLEIDDLYAVEWAYIPHFYYNFYVYQYATSLAASSLLAEAVINGRPGAVENYLNLLKAGGSDYPHELLKRAGVNMTSPEPYRAVFARMNTIMDQIEGILDGQDASPAP
jgi:oligoendopeptidase F